MHIAQRVISVMFAESTVCLINCMYDDIHYRYCIIPTISSILKEGFGVGACMRVCVFVYVCDCVCVKFV